MSGKEIFESPGAGVSTNTASLEVDLSGVVLSVGNLRCACKQYQVYGEALLLPFPMVLRSQSSRMKNRETG